MRTDGGSARDRDHRGGYLATCLGAGAGLWAGGHLGAWVGGLDEANDPFGAYRVIAGAFGAWIGLALGAWLVLNLFRFRLASPTALMVVLVSAPLIVIVGLLWSVMDARLSETSGKALAAAGVFVSGSLARWIVVGSGTDDPFESPPEPRPH